MINIEAAARQPISVVAVDPRTVDAAFEARWAAWVARGREHERRARHKFVVWGGSFAVLAAIVYAFLR